MGYLSEPSLIILNGSVHRPTLQVIKILKHNTASEPIYTALSDELRFHILYGESSIGSHNSIGAAIQSITNEHIYGVSGDARDWERLIPTSLTSNYSC